MHNFSLLPTELQATVAELREIGTPDAVIERLVDRTLAALEVKSNQVQVDVWTIEERLGKRLDQIRTALQADLQTQHGETNTMLLDLRTVQQDATPLLEEAGRGIADIKKSWADMGTWRDQVDAWRGTLDTRIEGFSGEIEDLRTNVSEMKAEIDSRRPIFGQILEELEHIKHDNLHDELNREERQELTAGLRQILARWQEVEALLSSTKQAGA